MGRELFLVERQKVKTRELTASDLLVNSGTIQEPHPETKTCKIEAHFFLTSQCNLKNKWGIVTPIFHELPTKIFHHEKLQLHHAAKNKIKKYYNCIVLFHI